MACGTFDLLHVGHRFFLREADKLGTELVVLVAQDSNVRKIKNKTPRENAELRKEKVAKLAYVDKVVIGDEQNFAKILHDLKPDILALGYDQEIPAQITDFSQQYPQIQVVKISSHKPHIYKTTLLAKK